jgi:hypothetical protein
MPNVGFKHSPESKAKIAAALRGRQRPAEVVEKIAAAQRGRKHSMHGEGHYLWRGDEASYRTIHSWLNRNFPKVGLCEQCGADVGGRGHAGTHYAFLRHPEPYTRNRDDYRELCPKCHTALDRQVPQEVAA